MGSPAFPLPRFLSLLLLCAFLSACGTSGDSGNATEDVDPNPFPGPVGGGNVPPPDPETQPVWNPAAATHSRVALFGSFSSDLVRHGTTIFAVDADQIDDAGARIRPFDVSGNTPVASATFAVTTIADADLQDSQGAQADAGNPVGFGFFLNDVLIVNDTLGFALANAGGSDSIPTLSNLVAFNPTTGAVLQTVGLATLFTSAAPLFDSTGVPLPPGAGFTQSGAEGLGYVPTSTGGGLLYVAMSNLIFGAPSFGAVKFPGTLQIWRVDPGQPTIVTPEPDAANATRTLLTGGYNPVAVDTIVAEPLASQVPATRILVTQAGTTAADASFNLMPVTPARVDAYEGATGALLGGLDLGLAGLSGVRPALGTDQAGQRVGFFPSSVTGEIYLCRLDGFYRAIPNQTEVAVLRGPANGIPITAALSGGPGGNVTGIALSRDGAHLVACGFGDLFAAPAVPGQLFLLSLPSNLVTGAEFGAAFTPGSTTFGTAPGRTLGNVVIVPGNGTRPEIYVNVSGTLDENFFGVSPAGIGSLSTFGLID